MDFGHGHKQGILLKVPKTQDMSTLSTATNGRDDACGSGPLVPPVGVAPTLSFQTLGCRLNQSESDTLAQAFCNEGYQIVADSVPSDICVINTCSVTESAESKCRYIIRKILQKSPATFIAVTGCYAQIGVEALRKIEGVDLIAGSDHKMLLPSLIQNASRKSLSKLSEPLVFHSPKISKDNFTIPTVGLFNHQTRPNIKIQDGCDFFCSFCIIPYTRGRERSRAFDNVLLEASLWAAQGHKEIVLTGVNLGHYSYEGRELADLIVSLEEIKGLARIRISSIEPTTVSPRLLDYMGTTKLCPHLHLPLQSGSNTILANMGRRYTREDYVAFVNEAMNKVPQLALGTDVMVGFPGESEAEFHETVSLLSSLPFAYLHVFPFSERKGTRLTRMGLQNVSSSIIRKRSQILHDLSKKKKEAFYTAAIGKTFDVLFENRNVRATHASPLPETKEDFYSGYTGNYIRVGVASKENLAGAIRKMRIESVTENLALGSVEK